MSTPASGRSNAASIVALSAAGCILVGLLATMALPRTTATRSMTG